MYDGIGGVVSPRAQLPGQSGRPSLFPHPPVSSNIDGNLEIYSSVHSRVHSLPLVGFRVLADEVLAISEKVVLRVDDLMDRLVEVAQWDRGLEAVWDKECREEGETALNPLTDSALDFQDVIKEKVLGQNGFTGPNSTIFPKYKATRTLKPTTSNARLHATWSYGWIPHIETDFLKCDPSLYLLVVVE
uniref:(California timema) hypothetical protein n=1 Tax=Timema californicum TaxID=61474 RepID=A0A7R9J378_TIMCA|nr:unnamed protein product [Timema californicum]